MPKWNAFSPILHQFASIRFRKKPEKDDSGKIRKKKWESWSFQKKLEKAWKFLSLFREGAYFKVRRFIQMKIQNFGIAFSEVTVNNLLSFWYIVIHILELLVIFYMISFFFTITIMLWYILAWVLGMLLSCYWDFFLCSVEE